MVVIAVMRQYAFPWHQLSPSDTVEAAVLGGSSQRSLSPSWTQMLLTCVYASSLFALLASSLSDIALFADINCRSTSGTFLWPLPSLGMYCLGLPAICEWSCLPYLLGSIEVRIWGLVGLVRHILHARMLYYIQTLRVWISFTFLFSRYIHCRVLKNPVQ